MHDFMEAPIDPDEIEDEEEFHKCPRCGMDGLVVEYVGKVPKLFVHVGLRLREHKCDFTQGKIDGFD